MVGSGCIDHAHHAGIAYRALTDIIEFTNAVKVVRELTSSTDTLAIVVAAIIAATLSFYIASTEARLEIELHKAQALQDAQIKQLESEDHYVKVFMDRILRTGNKSQELRYAKYFSIVSATKEQRERWAKYYEYLRDENQKSFKPGGKKKPLAE